MQAMRDADAELRAQVTNDIEERTLEGAARWYGMPASTLARFAAGAGSRAGTVALIRAKRQALAISCLPSIVA